MFSSLLLILGRLFTSNPFLLRFSGQGMVFNTKEWGSWNFKRLSLEVTFWGLATLTLTYPFHMLHTENPTQEDQASDGNWEVAFSLGGRMLLLMNQVQWELKGHLRYLLSWFCPQWYMKFTLKSWVRTQGLFEGKWPCRERSGFFNYAMTFSE